MQGILCSALLGLWKFPDPRCPGPWYEFAFGCSDLPACTHLDSFGIPNHGLPPNPPGNSLGIWSLMGGGGRGPLWLTPSLTGLGGWELNSGRNKKQVLFNFKENPSYLYAVHIWIPYNLWGAGTYTPLRSPISCSPRRSKCPFECLKPTFTNTIFNGG